MLIKIKKYINIKYKNFTFILKGNNYIYVNKKHKGRFFKFGWRLL